VINLSGDKRKTLAEAFRVLKPGGRFAVSDVVVRGEAPEAVRRSMELWVGCVAGALEEQEFLSLLREVGFENPSIEPTRIYRAEDAAAFLANTGLAVEQFARDIDGKFMGAFVRATKPGETTARGPAKKLIPLAAAVAANGDACCAPGCCSAPTVRLATRADEAAVSALLVASQLPLDGVREALPCFVVAHDGDRLVGVAGIEACGAAGHHALLRSVAVDPAWRGRGLGRTLVERAIALAEQRGTKALYLLTTTAEHYFPSFGFVQTSREAVPDDVRQTAEFQGACPASATVMMRES
jgi:N-acetylglutamate synthase-like GNAT family acetyltransferase